jgi:AraC-like DNA-binding protein
MIGRVTTRSAYITREAARGMPLGCRVLEISPLLRELLVEAVDVPVEYEKSSRAEAVMTLLLLDLRVAPTYALAVPFPRKSPLADRCRNFLERPSMGQTIDDWAVGLSMSRRAFTRHFRRETGMSFADWRRRAAVLQAIPRIAAGEAITTIALDLDYGSSAAFTSMFKRTMGAPPRHFAALLHQVDGDEQ